MAEVADLFLLHLEASAAADDEDLESDPIDFAFDTDDDNETLDPSPLCSSIFEEETLIPSWPNQPLFLSESDSHISRSETDLFHRFPVPDSLDTSDFRALHSSDYLGIELGLGFDNQEDDEIDHPVIQIDGDSLQVVGFGSDGESENPNPEADEDLNLPPFCWDSLRLEEERVGDDDFEWEEVDGRIDERDILSMMVGEGSQEHEDEEEEDELRNVQWEVLLAVNNPIEYEEGDFGIPSEYEILFGQFADAVRGSPPAKKSVVESLKEVVLTKEAVEKGNAMCAVCKDEMEGKAKELPCSHRYHGECILPWLGMRNTCPVCRFELPTDDVEYESWKAHRSGVGNEMM